MTLYYLVVLMGVDRWGMGGTRPPTFQLGGDHIGNVPPPTSFAEKVENLMCFYLLLTYIRLSACLIATGVLE